MKGIMIQGTSSDAGKSFLVTGLCRLLSDRGVKVCPFKSQNMSNNSCVTWDGCEVSRAQAVQAEAARLRPETFMNPVLLKPRRDTSSEIILEGRVLDVPAERDYYRTFTKNQGIEAVRRALRHIEQNFEAVVIEGAGSPAEINLNDSEIVNMRVAREADVPVLLVTDVDRGGSLASIVGTLELLGPDRERVRGLIFNKFRGDLTLFEPAVRWIENYTGIKVVGVMPWVSGAAIAGEDSLSIRWSQDGSRHEGGVTIGVVRFPSVSNFTDLDPFELEPDVSLVGLDESTPAGTLKNLDAVILPGAKNTMQDMAWLRRTGLARAIQELSRSGRFVLGLCGGYQMLGQRLLDPDLRENTELKELDGLGLLPAVTNFQARSKQTVCVSGYVRPEFNKNKIPVSGYEIHFGQTEIIKSIKSEKSEKEKGKEKDVLPLFELSEEGQSTRSEGMARPGLSVAGTYLHGVLEGDGFRTLWLNALRKSRGLDERPLTDTHAMKEAAYDALARAVKEHLDTEAVFNLMSLSVLAAG